LQRFTELKVWQQSHALALEVYRLTRSFPSEERFGLASQLRRAVLSVPTNIVEGSKRSSRQDYARFLNVAEGSLAETEYLIIFSRDIGYVTAEVATQILSQLAKIAGMLNNLRAKVEEKQVRPAQRSR